MNQRPTATADIFSRWSEQAAGAAAAVQPTRAPFFAPLRDVDLPSPVAVLTGTHVSPASFSPGVADAVATVPVAWLDPLIPPDPAWADRPVPTVAWLASTLPPEGAAVSPDAAPAADDLEPDAQEGLRPPGMPEATTPGSDAPGAVATLLPLPVPGTQADFSPAQPPGERDDPRSDDIIRIAGAPATHGAANPPSLRSGSALQAMAAAADLAAFTLDGHRPGAEPAEAPATPRPPAVNLPGSAPPLLPAAPTSADTIPGPAQAAGFAGATDDESAGKRAGRPRAQERRRPSPLAPRPSPALAAGRLPGGSKAVDENAGATHPPARQASNPAEANPLRPGDDARPASLPPGAGLAPPTEAAARGAPAQRPQPAREVHFPREGDMASAAAPGRPLLPQRTVEAPGQEDAARQVVPAQAAHVADVPSQLVPLARPPGHPTAAGWTAQGNGELSSVPVAPASGEQIPPRAAQMPQVTQPALASAALETASHPAPAAANTAPAVSPSRGTQPRVVPPDPPVALHAALASAGPRAVQPAPSRVAERDDTLPGDAWPLPRTPVPASSGGKQPEPHVAAPPPPSRHDGAIRPAAPAQTSAGHTSVQHPGVTQAEAPHAPALAVAAPPVARPHSQADARASAPAQPPGDGMRQAQSPPVPGTTWTAQRTPTTRMEPSFAPPVAAPAPAAAPQPAMAVPAPEVAPAAARLQPRMAAVAAHPLPQPMAAPQASLERLAVQPRSTQVAHAAAVAGRTERQVTPEPLPTVQVTIGRIEVRFTAPVVAQAPAARQPSRQNLPLNELLQRDLWGAA